MTMSPAVGRRRLALVVLAFSGTLAMACGDETSSPLRVTLVELVMGQDGYSGPRVETAGVVRRFDEADGATKLHYVIEDEQANRVAIVPAELADGRQTPRHQPTSPASQHTGRPGAVEWAPAGGAG